MVFPVKVLSAAKTRLATGAPSPGELALAFCRDALMAAVATPRVELVVVATNDERVDTDAVLAFFGIGHLFNVVVCAGEVNPPKPHPETVLAICRRLSVLPGEAVFVGDTVGDMSAGKRAGLAFTFGVLEGGVTPREELEKVADGVLDSIRDLKFFSFDFH